MRRKDRELTNIDDIFAVVKRCSVVHIAMIDDGKPYAVALNFGFDRQGSDLILYLHSAAEGKKIDILKKNPMVYLQMDCGGEFVQGTPSNPCSCSWRFDSVMGSGRVEFITDEAEQKYALNRIVQHLAQTEEDFEFPPQALAKTCTYKIISKDITGKHHA